MYVCMLIDEMMNIQSSNASPMIPGYLCLLYDILQGLGYSSTNFPGYDYSEKVDVAGYRKSEWTPRRKPRDGRVKIIWKLKVLLHALP